MWDLQGFKILNPVKHTLNNKRKYITLVLFITTPLNIAHVYGGTAGFTHKRTETHKRRQCLSAAATLAHFNNKMRPNIVYTDDASK